VQSDLVIVIVNIQLLLVRSCANDHFVSNWKCVLKLCFMVPHILYLASPICLIYFYLSCSILIVNRPCSVTTLHGILTISVILLKKKCIYDYCHFLSNLHPNLSFPGLCFITKLLECIIYQTLFQQFGMDFIQISIVRDSHCKRIRNKCL
jgi:hypothetical protein